MRIIKFIFSGEFLFAGFLLANVFKSALPGIPVDLNIIFFVFTVFIAVKRLMFKSGISKIVILPIALYMMFSIFALGSFFYSPSTTYALEKLLLLFTLSLWTFIAPFILINNRESLKKFLKSFLLISVITAIYGLISFNTEGETVERFGIAGANTIGLGRAVALGSIILILMYIFNRNLTAVKKIASFIAFIALLIVLFLTGARMALIGLVASILIYIILKTFKVRENKVYINKNSIKVASSFLIIPIVLIPFWSSLQFMFIRLSNLFDSSGHGAYTQRTNLFTVALDMWSSNLFNLLFGNGIGSYTIFFDGTDDRYYPHNIMLEVLSELGIIGLILFLALIITPFFINKNLKSNHFQIVVMLMFIYTFLNANTTGDLNDNRMMLAFLALMYMHPLFKFDEKQEFQVETSQ